MKLYYFTCGHHANIALKTKKQRDNITLTSRVCPKCHNGIVQCAQYYCSVCKKPMGIRSHTGRNKMCPDCRVERQKESKIRQFLKYREDSIKLKKAREKKNLKRTRRKDLEEGLHRFDCVFYLKKCMPEAAFKNTTINCEDCQRYISDIIGIVDYQENEVFS